MATSTTDRPHIVAVLGGNDVPPDVGLAARARARQAVAKGAMVLSGGDGRGVHHLNVKDEANAEADPRAGGSVF